MDEEIEENVPEWVKEIRIEYEEKVVIDLWQSFDLTEDELNKLGYPIQDDREELIKRYIAMGCEGVIRCPGYIVKVKDDVDFNQFIPIVKKYWLSSDMEGRLFFFLEKENCQRSEMFVVNERDFPLYSF